MNPLMLRRRAMMASIKAQPLSNPKLIYTPDIIGPIDAIQTRVGAGVTDYLAAAGGDVIYYYNPPTSLVDSSSNKRIGQIGVYKSNKARIDTWNCRQGAVGSFTCKSGTAYITINVDYSNETGSYAYNQATGVIYYAGKDTPYYGMTNIND